MVQPEKQQVTIWCTQITCWLNKARDTYSEYVILIAFPWQQWVCESASMLHLHI